MKSKSLIFIKANIAVFFAELFNALNINAQKYLLPEWSSATTMFFIRTAFAFILFAILGLFMKSEKVVWKDKFQMILTGMIFLGGYILFYLFGVQDSSPIDSSLIFTTMPVFVLIISILTHKEKSTRLKIAGLILALTGTIGLILITSPQEKDHSNSLTGNIFCLLSAFSYAMYLIYNKKFVAKYSTISMLKWMFLGAFLISVPFMLIQGIDLKLITHISQNPYPLYILLFVLIFPTGLTYFLLPFGLKYLNTTAVSMYDYEVPIVATIVAVTFTESVLTFYQVAGALLIFIGVYLVSKEKQSTTSFENEL
ncbi:MAG: DMT family transporter [Bacteroidales bacterium]